MTVYTMLWNTFMSRNKKSEVNQELVQQILIMLEIPRVTVGLLEGCPEYCYAPVYCHQQSGEGKGIWRKIQGKSGGTSKTSDDIFIPSINKQRWCTGGLVCYRNVSDYSIKKKKRSPVSFLSTFYFNFEQKIAEIYKLSKIIISISI